MIHNILPTITHMIERPKSYVLNQLLMMVRGCIMMVLSSLVSVRATQVLLPLPSSF